MKSIKRIIQIQMKARRCNRCKNVVRKSKVDGYVYSCNFCDEDLYTFETFTENDRIKE